MSELLNLIRDFLSALFTGSLHASRKRREMKKAAHELRQRNPNIFHFSSNEIMPPFPAALYKLSRYVRTLTRLFDRTIFHADKKTAERFRDYLVEGRLTEDDRLRKSEFTAAAMRARLERTGSFQETMKAIEADFEKYLALFRQPEFADFNREYAQVERLADLTRFPFEKILSFFDPHIASPDVGYKPRFAPVLAQNLTQDLMELYFTLSGCEPGADTAEGVVILHHRLMRIPDADEAEKIRKLVGFIRTLLDKYFSRQSLLCLIRLSSENAALTLPEQRDTTDFLEIFKTRLRARFELEREKLRREHTESEVAADLKNLLHGAALLDVRGYTAGVAQELADGGFDTFTHIQAIRILKTFVSEFFEPHIKEHVKMLVIDGFFEDKEFKDRFIGFFHTAQAAVDDIGLFEDTLNGTGDVSLQNLRGYLEKHRNGKTVEASLNQLVEAINENASRLIERLVGVFFGFSRALDELLADAKQRAPAIVSNINVMGGERNADRLARLHEDAEALSLFLSIMKHFTVIGKKTPRTAAAPPRRVPG